MGCLSTKIIPHTVPFYGTIFYYSTMCKKCHLGAIFQRFTVVIYIFCVGQMKTGVSFSTVGISNASGHCFDFPKQRLKPIHGGFPLWAVYPSNTKKMRSYSKTVSFLPQICILPKVCICCVFVVV